MRGTQSLCSSVRSVVVFSLRWIAPAARDTATASLEKRLWSAADQLRANSGLSVADMERTVGMPALALIRSGGLLFVRAANEGRTVIELFPREKITSDFDELADRVLGATKAVPVVKTGFRLPTRAKEPIRV